MITIVDYVDMEIFFPSSSAFHKIGHECKVSDKKADIINSDNYRVAWCWSF